MPVTLAVLATAYGSAYGLFPIFWIIFPVLFLYRLTVRAGRFALLERCLLGVTIHAVDLDRDLPAVTRDGQRNFATEPVQP